MSISEIEQKSYNWDIGLQTTAGVEMQLPLFDEPVHHDAAALERCAQADVVAIDIETETRWPGYGPRLDYGLSYPAAVTVIALAWKEGEVQQSTVLTAPFDPSVRTFLKRLFSPNRLLVAHNAVFDIRQLSKLTDGHIPDRIWDTYVMARLLHPAVNASYNLTAVAEALNIPVHEEHQALKGQRARLHTLPLSLILEYAGRDAQLTLQIYERQRKLPGDRELIEWECRAMREYCRMAAQGIRLNIPFVEQRLTELSQQRDVLVRRLSEDGLSTPGSPKERARYLYFTKGIPLPRYSPDAGEYFTRAGRRRLREQPDAEVLLSDLSTRGDVIESYMEDGSPYRDQLQDLATYLETDWLLSTLNGLLEHAVEDGRLHSLVTIATESGRRASSYPHMQNWKMPAMAGVATGDEGFTLVEIDYSNAENVMAAMIASDDNLAAACDAEDFHSMMAAQYFAAEWPTADNAHRKHLRTLAKKITYGTAYGMGADSLGRSLGLTTEEAQVLMQAKDRAFPKVTRLRNAAKRQARDTGMLRLWTARPVAVPSAFVAWNYLCQGGVSELLKRAIVRISEAFEAQSMDSRIALDMHDALVLEIAHHEWDAALSFASEIMCTITPAALTHRTNPPIRWRAQPNIAENRKKWGALQWHPGEESHP